MSATPNQSRSQAARRRRRRSRRRRRQRRRTSACIGIVAVIALVALGVGGRMWYRSHHYVETENAYVAGHVTPVSARIAGVVTRVLVEDNQIVKAGDVIAELDPADQHVKVEQIQAQIASAEQQVLQADAQVAQVRRRPAPRRPRWPSPQAAAGARPAGRRALRPVVQHHDEGRLEGRSGCRQRRARRRHRRRRGAPRQRAGRAGPDQRRRLGARRAQGAGQGAADPVEGRQAAARLQPASSRRWPAASAGAAWKWARASSRASSSPPSCRTRSGSPPISRKPSWPACSRARRCTCGRRACRTNR